MSHGHHDRYIFETKKKSMSTRLCLVLKWPYLKLYLLVSWNFDVRDTSRTCFYWSIQWSKCLLANELTRFFRFLTSKFYEASQYNCIYEKTILRRNPLNYLRIRHFSILLSIEMILAKFPPYLTIF